MFQLSFCLMMSPIKHPLVHVNWHWLSLQMISRLNILNSEIHLIGHATVCIKIKWIIKYETKKKTFLTTQYCRCLLQLSKSFYFQGICLYAIWFMIESGVSASMYSINKHYMHNSVYACSDLLNCFYMDIYSSFKRICLLLSNQKRINI